MQIENWGFTVSKNIRFPLPQMVNVLQFPGRKDSIESVESEQIEDIHEKIIEDLCQKWHEEWKKRAIDNLKRVCLELLQTDLLEKDFSDDLICIADSIHRIHESSWGGDITFQYQIVINDEIIALCAALSKKCAARK
ncbi:MAG: hypothetical protein RIB84_28710 [Sneathiellaceae bacterium]